MMKRNVIPRALLCILVTAFLIAQVSAGLNVTDGAKITSPYGATSPVITVRDSDIPAGSIITIDVSGLYQFVYSGTVTNANVVISSNTATATWTGRVSGGNITLSSTGGNTTVGENITVTLTGAGGNPWLPGTTDIYGDTIIALTVTRLDTGDTAIINFWIETPTPPPGGLTITDGAKITSASGATSPVITIADADILQNDTITIKVPDLYLFVNNGTFTDANVVIDDNASSATWTRTVSGPGDLITLTSTGGPTVVGENITVTITGAGGNPWYPDTSSRFGDMVLPLTVTRTDTFQTASLNFMINTTPPSGGLSVADGAKITTALGTTSPVIAIAGTVIPAGGAITIDVSNLNAYVASGTFTDANVVMNETAGAANWTHAVAGNILTLVSTGGSTAIGEKVTVTLTGAGGNAWVPNTHGAQTIPLTATRTDTGQKGTFNFIIETSPPPNFTVIANFLATPTSGMPPLTVAFNDTSLGNPTSWNWDFGDSSTSASRNPSHTYTHIGSYTVSLNATNAYGSDTITQWDYIKVLSGAVRQANTSIAGLTISNCEGPQSVSVDTSILPAALIPNNSVLEIQPPADRGFKNITIDALNGVGFSRQGDLIVGNPTSVHLVTEDIAPSTGFSANIGANSSFNYSIDLLSYPCNAILSTKIWEGVIPEYDIKIRQVLDKNNAGLVGTAYSAKVTKTNFPSTAPVNVHMSVNSNWNPSLPGGPGMMFIWRIADDGNSGQVLPTNYLYNNTVDNLDFYEANSPLGLSTFGLSALTGNNNPFQVISFVLTEIISPPSSDSSVISVNVSVVVQNTTSPAVKTPVPPDPGRTAKIYLNAQGVITQATTLESTDGLASISLREGIVAKNGTGAALSSITIKSIPDGSVPGIPDGSAFTFAGRAYDLQPDGATFSPGITISFITPNAKFGQELLVKTYDSATNTWLDLPTSVNPQTGIITAQISHLCCFAVFAKFTEAEKAPTPQSTIIVASKSSISTDVGMYSWIISTVVQNPVIIVIVLSVLALVSYFGWWKRRL